LNNSSIANANNQDVFNSPINTPSRKNPIFPNLSSIEYDFGKTTPIVNIQESNDVQSACSFPPPPSDFKDDEKMGKHSLDTPNQSLTTMEPSCPSLSLPPPAPPLPVNPPPSITYQRSSSSCMVSPAGSQYHQHQSVTSSSTATTIVPNIYPSTSRLPVVSNGAPTTKPAPSVKIQRNVYEENLANQNKG
jgi:hypothetical protein